MGQNIGSDPASRPSNKGTFRLSPLLKEKYRSRFKVVFSAIDLVHGVPPLEKVDLRVSQNKVLAGKYLKHGGTGKPQAIEISVFGETIELTLAHEIGHFLEGAAIPGSMHGVRHWEFDKVTREWSAAVLASETVRRLETIRAEGQVEIKTIGGNRENRPIIASHLSYVTSRQELWARSYAQYIAARSGDKTLLGQLEARRSPSVVLPLQWTDAEFRPIAGALDRLFREMGW